MGSHSEAPAEASIAHIALISGRKISFKNGCPASGAFLPDFSRTR